jgi:hypothetical protein
MNTKMKRIAIASLCGFAALCVIASCSRHDDVAYVQPQQAPAYAAAPTPAYAGVQAPVVVQAAPSHDGLLTGLLVGHMLSGGGNSRVVEHHYTNGPAPQRNVVQNVTKNVTVNKTYVQQAAPRTVTPSVAPTRPAYSGYSAPRATSSYSSGYSSGRSSYSSSSYSSRSYSGGSYGRR